MVRNVLKRYLSMMLAVVLSFTLFGKFYSTDAYAATQITGLTDSGISASYEGSGTHSWSASGTTLNGSATGTKGTCSSSSANTTLTIKNNKTATATLSFDYTLTLNGGSAQVDGSTVTANGSFSKAVEPGNSIQVKITSASGASTTSIVITNLSMLVDVNATATFVPGENGSLTVDGNPVDDSYTNSQSSTIAYNVTATPIEGYKFMGWYDQTHDVYLSNDLTASFNIEQDSVIMPVFIPVDSPVFETNGKNFADLNEAVAFAQEHNSKQITLIGDGTLTGNYEIPEGITLLIPYDEAKTVSTTKPDTTGSSYTAPSAYKTLTMSEGSSLVINGTLNVNAKHSASATGGKGGGAPSGKYGYIVMNDGSNITIGDGGALYAYGYISGNGNVTAQSGSVVYENMQIRDFRGGSATLNMYNNNEGVFPFSQYYVQNIEAPLTIESGAEEYLYTSIYANSTSNGSSIKFIGSDNAMFILDDGASLKKAYDPSRDRLDLTVNGDATLSALSLSLSGMNFSSSDYVLPITNNISLNIESGTTTIGTDTNLLPGVEVSIDEGAAVDIAKNINVYVYDADQWNNNNYTYIGKFGSVSYSPTKSYTRKASDIKDVLIDVNGEIITDGYLYTTEGGADIISSEGTGKVTMNSGAGTKTNSYQATQSGTTVTFVAIPITSVKLHNGTQYIGTDEEYALTDGAAAGDEFNYTKVVEKWNAKVVVFDGNGAEGSMNPVELVNGSAALPANVFSREGYEFLGWSTSNSATEAEYADGATVSFDKTTVLYAVWKKDGVTVTWMNDDGATVLETDVVQPGETATYDGQTPTKAEDDLNTYEFAGWTPEVGPVTQDTTYTAVYTATPKTYTITWTDENGNVLAENQAQAGTIPEYTGAVPYKEGNAQYSYEFAGWTPAVTTVTGNATYTATYSQILNSYTVTFLDYDGSVLSSSYVSYGTVPTYPGEPTREGTDEFSYSFAGWTPNVTEVTGDAVYTATYTEKTNTYTVTWSNYDGSVLDVQTVEYGVVPGYAGAVPFKPEDEQNTYEFAGWQPTVSAVTGNVQYTAQFTPIKKQFAITWIVEGAATTTYVEYGNIPDYGSEPTKASTEDDQYVYTYKFKGWTPNVTQAVGEATYTAEFDEIKTVKTYTVTWVNDDGTVLETDESIEYGAAPTYDGTEPVKEADAQYTYTFAGWTPEVSSVTGNATYTATYNTTTNAYTVTWVNRNGTVLETDTDVSYGTTPTYDGATPALPADAHYSYEFSGWDPAVSAVTGNITYVAQFEEKTNTYTVVWMMDDGETVLRTDEDVPYGSEPVYQGDTPTKKSTAEFDYTFTGWNIEEGTVITGDMTFTANFEATVRSYTITWDVEGETRQDTFEYGTIPSYGSIPSKEADAQYSYVFDTWTPDIKAVEADATYKAVFKKTTRTYSVRWLNDDGSLIQSDAFEYGTMPEFTGDTPTKAKDEQFAYKFKGWTPELTEVNGDVEYTAVYESIPQGWNTDSGDSYVDGEEPLKDGIYRLPYDGSNYTEPEWTDALDHGHPEDGKGTFIIDENGNVCREINGFYELDITKINPDYPTEWLIQNGRVWVVNGEIVWHPGLVNVDGEFYYFKTANSFVQSQDYRITKTNDLSFTDENGNTVNFVQGGNYTFDSNGVLQLYDGITDVDGTLYYYENGVKTYAGLIQVGDDYYYVSSSGKLVVGRDYYVTKHNNLLPAGTYTFDNDGKLILPEPKFTGIKADEDGVLHYYVEDEIQKGSGLIEFEGNFYYVNGSGVVVSGKDYAINTPNGLSYTFADGTAVPFEKGHTYTFDENGILQMYDGITEIDGESYYYVHGVKTYAGLIKIGDDYYYVNSSCKLVKSTSYVITKTNDLLPADKYDFDADGKLIIKAPGFTGIKADDEGVLRYYVNGAVQTNSGLVEVDGSFYYVNSSGVVISGKDYTINTPNGLSYTFADGTSVPFEKGRTYTFDENGKLLIYDGITEIDGESYYYVHGVKTYAGLIKIGDDYYYVNSSCKLVKNKKYYISKNNGLLPAAYYQFDANGVLIQ